MSSEVCKQHTPSFERYTMVTRVDVQNQPSTSPRFILHLRCVWCARGFFAAAPLLVPPCPACRQRRLQRVGSWDLTLKSAPMFQGGTP